MALDYFLLIFIASIGVFQIAAIHGKLEGLWFFRRPLMQYIFGVLAIIGAFGWFFRAGVRNEPHSVEGSQQLGLFLSAIIAAYIITAILSSVIRFRLSSQRGTPRKGKQYEQGVETLKTKTVFGGIVSSLRRERKDPE